MQPSLGATPPILALYLPRFAAVDRVPINFDVTIPGRTSATTVRFALVLKSKRTQI